MGRVFSGEKEGAEDVDLTISLAELQIRNCVASYPWLVLLIPVNEVGIPLLLRFQRFGDSGIAPLI